VVFEGNSLAKKHLNEQIYLTRRRWSVLQQNVFTQGCQMVSFQTKNPNLGKFWRALDWKMLIYFMAIWNILQTFGIFYDRLVNFVFIWYIFPVLYQEKSGNPILTDELSCCA
jgi:hypothetical protein